MQHDMKSSLFSIFFIFSVHYPMTLVMYVYLFVCCENMTLSVCVFLNCDDELRVVTIYQKGEFH